MTHDGTIISIKNQVIEVAWHGAHPETHDLLQPVDDDSSWLEVYTSASADSYNCFVLTDQRKLAVGQHVTNTHRSLAVPVGPEVLGRAINVFGQPVDGQDLQVSQRRNVFDTTALTVDEVSPRQAVLQTGIKAIDFFAPILLGGKTGLFGGAGVGKTILLTELINNVVVHAKDEAEQSDNVAIFSAVGERSREAQELLESLSEAGVLSKTVLVVGQMGENPAVRFRSAFASARLAEYFRDEYHSNVLFFMDNMYRFAQAGYELSTLMNTIPSEDGYQPTLPSEVGALHERLSPQSNNSVTSIEAVYVPSDDLTDYGVRAIFPYLDSRIVLSRDISQQGRLPAIDLLASDSIALTPDLVGQYHYELYLESKQMLERSITIKRIVSLVGEEELSNEDKTIFRRSRLIENYMTQPFFVVANQTTTPGERVPLKATLADVENIMRGAFDEIDPDQLLFRGSLQTGTDPAVGQTDDSSEQVYVPTQMAPTAQADSPPE